MAEGQGKTIVRLIVRSRTMSSAQITEELGLMPDETWSIGDPRAPAMRHDVNGWLLESRLGHEHEVADHVRDVLARLEASGRTARGLADRCTMLMSCVVYASRPPALYFESDLIEAVARLGAALDFDLYIGEEFGP